MCTFEKPGDCDQKEKLGKTNQLIERLCEILYFLVVKIGVPSNSIENLMVILPRDIYIWHSKWCLKTVFLRCYSTISFFQLLQILYHWCAEWCLSVSNFGVVSFHNPNSTSNALETIKKETLCGYPTYHRSRSRRSNYSSIQNELFSSLQDTHCYY